jgi:hypothetical protein
VRRMLLRLFAMFATGIAAFALPPAAAHASPAPVYPGMEIRQDTQLCTLGYVEPNLRTINDYEGITLAPDVTPSNVLPGGRSLASDPGFVINAGQAVCHYGVVTHETCGTVEAVYNGWFTMANGILSQKGDSGGPVYVLTGDGRAVLVGIFNSTWGNFPAAVAWNAIRQQISEDVNAPSATVQRAAWQLKP